MSATGPMGRAEAPARKPGAWRGGPRRSRMPLRPVRKPVRPARGCACLTVIARYRHAPTQGEERRPSKRSAPSAAYRAKDIYFRNFSLQFPGICVHIIPDMPQCSVPDPGDRQEFAGWGQEKFTSQAVITGHRGRLRSDAHSFRYKSGGASAAAHAGSRMARGAARGAG